MKVGKFFLFITFIAFLVLNMNLVIQAEPNVSATLANYEAGDSSLMEKLKQNPKYILATTLLQSTIDLLETRITPEQHKRLSQWQERWVNGERDMEVSQLAKTMPLEQAHIKATVERMRILIRIAAVVPPSSTYENEFSLFSASVQDNTVTVYGSARNAEGQSCSFKGIGALNRGWVQISNESANDFYVLFTPKAAYIAYVGSNKDMGCPENVSFSGPYVKE